MDHYGRKANQSESAKEFWMKLQKPSPLFLEQLSGSADAATFRLSRMRQFGGRPPKRHAPQRWTHCSWWGTYMYHGGFFMQS